MTKLRYFAIHVGDFKRNDDIYEELEKQKLDDVFRMPRTLDEMKVESDILRSLFN